MTLAAVLLAPMISHMIDKSPISEEQVLEHVGAVLRAENEVKKLQVAMLIQLKNLLTDEQIEYLQSAVN